MKYDTWLMNTHSILWIKIIERPIFGHSQTILYAQKMHSGITKNK